jgi:hypothetical protein
VYSELKNTKIVRSGFILKNFADPIFKNYASGLDLILHALRKGLHVNKLDVQKIKLSEIFNHNIYLKIGLSKLRLVKI